MTIFDLPWDKMAAFLSFWIALLALVSVLGARIPKVNKWLGVSIQNLLGITDLASRLDSYIRINDESGRKRDSAIAELADAVKTFVEKKT